MTAEGIRAGRLVTIAAEAIRDDVLPKLEGTTVDRSVDLRPDVLMTMAYQAAHGDVAEPDEIASFGRTCSEISVMGATSRPSGSPD